MYLIVGANGFLGSYLIKNILNSTDSSILATSVNVPTEHINPRVKWVRCDITNVDDVCNLFDIVGDTEINIFYLAAYHHPDLVMKNPKTAWDINIIALARFLNIMKNVRCFIYPSTDTVYGEGNIYKKFKETDQLAPLNLYGKHKLAAECLVTTYGMNVVRFPFLIGPSLLAHKKHFYDEIVLSLSENKLIKMFSDSIRSSLDFNTAATLALRLTETRTPIPQILNISGDDALSKYDVGVMIAKKYGYNTSLIQAVTAEETAGIFEARRSQIAILDNTSVKQYLGLDSIKINI